MMDMPLILYTAHCEHIDFHHYYYDDDDYNSDIWHIQVCMVSYTETFSRLRVYQQIFIITITTPYMNSRKLCGVV